jgi:hypothetical protein
MDKQNKKGNKKKWVVKKIKLKALKKKEEV